MIYKSNTIYNIQYTILYRKYREYRELNTILIQFYNNIQNDK